jgi:DNA polymerase-3 subunit beta
MKFSINKEAFLAGLQQVQHVVTTRTTLPILSNVLLRASRKGLQLATTDLDVSVSGIVEAEISEAGGTTLPARRLFSIIRELPAEEIAVSVDEKNVAAIRCGPSHFKIMGLGDEEFPALPTFADAKEFKLPQSVLKDLLRKTSYAISTDEMRFVLNGILCSFKNNTLTMVATDGRRLAMADQELEFPQSNECDIIIPTKAVNEIQRLLGDQGDVVLKVGTGQIGLELGSYTLTSKLIEGNYPNYRQVIPSETKERITLEREPLLRTLTRVSLLLVDKSNSIKLRFTRDKLRVEANAPDVGEAHEEIPINYKGADITIAFNPEFLMAPLRNLPADEFHLHLIDDISPGVIRSGTTFLYVLMPMRVNS